ncbi:MAG: 23S rRNA (pseudouridine(1915)-N(3))-methyltransferase RlmH [Chthoniobacterales bacterium]|nr:23S rRNA (pseudouridine(1915)-N(3))-methyltransferase RlmH [Chthoniobacterales bacterium]
MKWLVLTVGKPALPYAKAGRDEYLRRIALYAKINHEAIKASDRTRESAELLERSRNSFRLVLDEKGRAFTSREFARFVDSLQLGARPVTVIVGGADGHDEALTRAADTTWSLAPLTLQHELALVVALEQIYRAHTIIAGHPYHRD